MTASVPPSLASVSMPTRKPTGKDVWGHEQSTSFAATHDSRPEVVHLKDLRCASCRMQNAVWVGYSLSRWCGDEFIQPEPIADAARCEECAQKDGITESHWISGHVPYGANYVSNHYIESYRRFVCAVCFCLFPEPVQRMRCGECLRSEAHAVALAAGVAQRLAASLPQPEKTMTKTNEPKTGPDLRGEVEQGRGRRGDDRNRARPASR